MKNKIAVIAFLLVVAPSAFAQTSQPASFVKQDAVERQMQTLAGDEMRGRGSATDDEFVAANYIASELRRFQLEPAGNNGGFVQHIAINVKSQGETKIRYTANVVGILRGSDPQLSKEVVLLTAHLDHLGIRKPVNGDAIYNGADDDASGVIAVLQLAEALTKASTPPKRTIVFALFGSEEIGGYGARYFLEHPAMPLENIVANLEFEMIGRSDKTVAPHTLWLTGYDLSDLGAELAKHGARLVADPHPDQHFFQRSDNYTLAKRGVIAHTVSSFGLHKDYHQPSDDIAHIDFAHMTEAINSMIEPVRWLVNSDFKPKWVEGKNPATSDKQN